MPVLELPINVQHQRSPLVAHAAARDFRLNLGASIRRVRKYARIVATTSQAKRSAGLDIVRDLK